MKRRSRKSLRRRLRKVIYGGITRMLKPETPPARTELDEAPVTAAARSGNDGVLRLDQSGRLPTALAEASESDDESWLPSRLVVLITLLALLFIAIITWFISEMPAKP